MTAETIIAVWNLLTIFTGFSAAPTQLFRPVISLSTLLRPRWKKKERRESEFDQKHNIRDVIGGRTCADRFRCFSIYRGNTCGDVVCFYPFFRFFLSCFPRRENYIAKRHVTLSQRRGIVPWRNSCAIIRESQHGCRHLSIHSHLLSDVHWRHR